MKKPFLLLAALSLTFLSCGQEEKTETEFARRDNPQQNQEISPQEFNRLCTLRNGIRYPGPNGVEVCEYRSANYSKNEQQMREEFSNRGMVVVALSNGDVPAGSKLIATVKGGLPVHFFINENTPVTSVHNGSVGPVHVPKGRLTARIYEAPYENVSISILSCFTQQTREHICRLP